MKKNRWLKTREKVKRTEAVLKEAGITDDDSWESYFRKMKGEPTKKLIDILLDDGINENKEKSKK